MFNLTSDQAQVVQDILTWDAEPYTPENAFAILIGAAGVGKTFVQKGLAERFRGRTCYTAPTNKAVRVQRDALKAEDFTPEVRTIYSLLQLRLEPNGEIRELTIPDEIVDLEGYRRVLVDESSMVNTKLLKYIERTSKEHKLKFLFVLDDKQINPVNEASIPVLSLKCRRMVLTKVLRHDNQILRLATAIRAQVEKPFPSITLESDHNETRTEGVWKSGPTEFLRQILSYADAGKFQANEAKVIAWRNATVDMLNAAIRRRLYDDPKPDQWIVGDRVVFAAPAKAQDDSGKFVAATDDEGVIESLYATKHPYYPDMYCWRVMIQLDDNRLVTSWLLGKEEEVLYQRKLAAISAQAKHNGRFWKDFWALKEAFHSVRHAYAITAHRSQGSTYEVAFVDWRDILANPRRNEAFRCLYVACTRPKQLLILN